METAKKNKRRVNYEVVFWQSRISAALRTGCACLMAGVAMHVHKRWLAFPVFAYVTAVTVVSEGSLGESLRSTFWVLLATVTGGALPAALPLWLLSPAAFSSLWVTAAAVAVTAFAAGFPDVLPITARRVIFAQTAIIYISAHVSPAQEGFDPVMFPLRIAGVTAIGAGSAVVAMLLPVPRLATRAALRKFRLSASVSADVLRHLVAGFLHVHEDPLAANSFRIHARSLSTAAANILKQLQNQQGDVKWEIPCRSKSFAVPRMVTTEFGKLKKSLLGMEMALKSYTEEAAVANPDSTFFLTIQQEMTESAQWACNALQHMAATVSASKKAASLADELVLQGTQALQSLDAALEVLLLNEPSLKQDLPGFFAVFNLRNLCKQLLQMLRGDEVAVKSESCCEHCSQTRTVTIDLDEKSTRRPWLLGMLRRTRRAGKCSLAMGLSVVAGLLYGGKHGYWAAIAVALSMDTTREATFRLANVRAQGTVAGSVYAVIATVLTSEYMSLRAVALVPWVIFTSFLRQSTTYGYAGGLSAFIAAIIMLGRRDEDKPTDFAITRIAQTFIGLACYIAVELALNATRASTLARRHLAAGLLHLADLATSPLTNPISPSPSPCTATVTAMQAAMNNHMAQLQAFVEEARLEPDFWFLPFPSSTYTNLLTSTTTMLDLLSFTWSCSATILRGCASGSRATWSSLLKPTMQLFESDLAMSLRCMGELLQQSSKSLDKILAVQGSSPVPSMEGSPRESVPEEDPGASDHLAVCIDPEEEEEEQTKDAKSTVEMMPEVIRRVHAEVATGVPTEVAALTYCMGRLAEESRVMESHVQELLQWENPWCLIHMPCLYTSLRHMQRHSA